MRANLKYDGQKGWLCLPYEYNAPVTDVCVADSKGKEKRIPIRLSVERVDLWMSYPLNDLSEGDLLLTSNGEAWLRAAYIGRKPAMQKRREMSRPRIHYMPVSGGMQNIKGIVKKQDEWHLTYIASPCILDNTFSEGTVMEIKSKDFLHWSVAEETSDKADGTALQIRKQKWWTGDIEEEWTFEDGDKEYTLARSHQERLDDCAGSGVLSVPAEIVNGRPRPAACLENLRVWERTWHNEAINKEFDFLMRFKAAPSRWPEISLLPKEDTVDDIQTKACEAELEIFAGQESELVIDFCGVKWKWDALEQNISCGKYRIKTPMKDGKIHLHMYSDMVVQEIFTGAEYALLVLQPEGPKKESYRIGSELVENINNESFCFPYNAEPYIKISAAGNSAVMQAGKVWGLRSVDYSEASSQMLEGAEKGEELFQCDHYTIYANCVEDKVYGPPLAWALNGGKTVLSPVRAKEEFAWRATPWGDMTRVINRTERWDAPEEHIYPKLHTKYPVLNAAFGIATDIMLKNRDEKYALPGQQGLMNAALFQGKGEGFGSWVRDTCHAAFRCQNLLAPQEIRESLAYISEHGFNNGEDCAAMPAIAAWDYYIATGDRQLLYEMLPGILRYAREADSRYNEEIHLVHADMCLAQDAFPEPENGGYCLGTEIAFSLMYQAVSKICREIGVEQEKGEEWGKKAESMLSSIRERYWNEEKSCFTSGPIGSEAYEKGWWEMTGAEMALWPRFGVSSDEQKKRFLDTIIKNPEACSDFGINWYPFRKEKNHFWRACWVSWTQGLADAASEAGNVDFLQRLIFGQVRNVLLNKSFHEVIDFDTGRAWRWPHLPWHAAAFIGYIVNSIFGIHYDKAGLYFTPLIPPIFEGSTLSDLRYRAASYDIYIHGAGKAYSIRLDGQEIKEAFGLDIQGKHRIDIYAGNINESNAEE